MLNKQQQEDFKKWTLTAMEMAIKAVPGLTPNVGAPSVAAGMWAVTVFLMEHPEVSPKSILEFIETPHGEPNG